MKNENFKIPTVLCIRNRGDFSFLLDVNCWYNRYMEFLQLISDFFSPERFIGFVQSPKALWYVLGFVFLIYAVLSCILVYHWRTYGMKSRLIIRAEITYFIVSLSLFCLAVLCIILI